MKITFLDFWIASPRVSPVISDTSNLLDYWISNSQSNPQFPLFYTGSAIADSTAIGVGTLLWASTGIALADSAANGAGGLLRPLAGTGNATADSIATAVGVRGKTSPLNYWISTSQRAPVFIEVANYLDYWIFSDRSSPQISEFAISSVGTATADSTANGVGATQVIETPSGGCECNSAVSTIQIFAETPSGGCECNSAVGTIQIFAETPSGGCECNSTVDAYKVYTEIPSGGCECNSAVDAYKVYTEIPSGGCECNSTVGTPNIFVEIPSGGCECGGSLANIYTEIPSGGCECNSWVEANIVPRPEPTPRLDSRWDLGVTFGVPVQKKAQNKIKVKFTYKENTYNYEQNLDPEISVILKGLGPKAKNRKQPSMVLETIKASNGQNYNS
jgi:hypothetical protein